MGRGFNCNLDIARSFHQITNYYFFYNFYTRRIVLTEDGRWDSTKGEGGGGESCLGR